MRKALIITFSLLLIIACEKAGNIFGIDPGLPDETGAGNQPAVAAITPANGAQITDQDNDQSGIQGQIEITFSNFMDEATLTATNFEIFNTTTGSAIASGVTYEYFPEIRKLFIYIDEVPSGSAYLLTLSDMTNRYGTRLDFDGDNIDDDTPYDDYLTTFYTTGNTDTLASVQWPMIANVDPYLERTSNQQPLITIDFGNTGAYGLDETTLGTSNFTLENSAGTAYPLSQVSVSGSQVRFQPTGDLPYGDNYTLTISCSNITMIAKSTTPGYITVLDGDNDGPEATEPDTGWYFRVDTIIPPTVNVSAIGSTGALFTFSDLIDGTTITFNTIRVIDDMGYVPGEFRIYTDADNNYTMVDYYYIRTISGGTNAFVSKDIQRTNGYYFDGSGNEIGGEPWDDLYTPF